VVTISDALAAGIDRLYPSLLNHVDVRVAPDGVDLERFQAAEPIAVVRQRLGLDSSATIAGYAGHLYPGRGIDLILELARRLPEVRFLIVGGEPQDVAHYTEFAATAGLENVALTGHVANSRLPDYLAACDMLLMPYQRRVQTSGGDDTASWMSPLKMFEYMAAERLIIASDLPALREVLDDSMSCLCDPEDADAWTAAIGRATRNAEWRCQAARNARKAVEKYTWRARVRQCL
jgi:glycosyltransferase involved in cell wall biosynthesis